MALKWMFKMLKYSCTPWMLFCWVVRACYWVWFAVFSCVCILCYGTDLFELAYVGCTNANNTFSIDGKWATTVELHAGNSLSEIQWFKPRREGCVYTSAVIIVSQDKSLCGSMDRSTIFQAPPQAAYVFDRVISCTWNHFYNVFSMMSNPSDIPFADTSSV